MAMNIGPAGREPDVMIDINTTPLIDVMLVLLVMLIITIPIQLHAVNLNLPLGNPPPPLVTPRRSSRSTSTRRARSTGTARRCPTTKRSSRCSRPRRCSRSSPSCTCVPTRTRATKSSPASWLRRRGSGSPRSESSAANSSSKSSGTLRPDGSRTHMDYAQQQRNPDPARDRIDGRHPGARPRHLRARHGPRPQGGAGDQEAAGDVDHRGAQAPAAAAAAAAQESRDSRSRRRRKPTFRRRTFR